ncbi:MAG: ptsH [Gemmataceae bacterium]|nr:ptsH [Gemmataceae bacterium]
MTRTLKAAGREPYHGVGVMTQGRAGNGAGAQDGADLPGGPTGQPACVPDPAGEGPIRRTVRITNPRGLHPRIIALFTKTAMGFASSVTLYNGDLQADGKSVWDLITLMAEQGADVVLEVAGSDAAAAVDPLAEILAAPGGEDYTI